MRYQSTGQNIVTSNKIDVLIGPYRSGKTLALLERALDNCINNPFESTTIVVPSQRYRALLDVRIAELFRQKLSIEDKEESGKEISGFVGLRILTFYQFCQSILMRLGSFDLIMPEAIRPILVTRLLNQRKAAGKLKSLASIADFRGTPLAVLSLIDELERAALSPEQVIMQLQKSLATHSRYMELAELYKDYWQCLDSIRQLDRRRLVFRLMQVLSEKESGSSLGFIAFDGFDRFNPLQLKIIRELGRHTKQLLISFDYLPPEEDAQLNYSWKTNSYTQLCEILVEQLEFDHSTAKNNAQVSARKPAVEKFVTTDRYFEMAQIAAQIKEAIVIESKKISDFLVVARSLKPYRSAVKAAFEDAGLDYFVDETIELRTLPIVQFILSIMSLHHYDFPRAETISVLRSPYFNSKYRLSGLELEELESISLNFMVVKSLGQWKEALAQAKSTTLSAKVQKIFELLSPPESEGFADVYVTWVEDLLEKVLVLPGADDSLDPFEHWEQDSALAQFRKSLAVLIQEHHTLIKLGHKATSTYAELFFKLENLIEVSNFRRQPRSRDYVLVTDADLAPNRIYDEIYIAGMIEGEFPQRVHQSGFTTVEEVDAWSRFGVDIHNPRFDPNFETALLRSLEQRARTKLVLSCPKNEMSGEELTPSFLLRDSDTSKTSAEQMAHPLEAFLTKPTSARNAIAAYLWANKSLALPTQLQNDQSLSEFIESLQDSVISAQARIRNTRGSVLNGYLVDHVAAGSVKVPPRKYWSASRLSDYGKCPFRYWVSHVAGVRREQEPEAKLAANVIGETYHKALEIFYNEIISKKLSLRNSEETLLRGIFDQSVLEALAWLNKHPRVRKGEFWHYECQDLIFRLVRFFQSERERAQVEDYVPLLVEASFGMDEEPAFTPALSLKNGDSEINIRGRIDRIDISTIGAEKSLRVVDYKSGSTRIAKDDALSGRNIQLPLYALAVERAIVKGSQVVDGQYLSIAQAASIGSYKFDQYEHVGYGEQVKLSEWAETLTKKFVNAIQGGDFSVRPNGYSVCQTCDHITICRIRELDATEQEDDATD